MPHLDLTDDEMRVVLNALIEAPLPWRLTNPILIKIQMTQPAPPPPGPPPATKTNSDKRHERRIPDQP